MIFIKPKNGFEYNHRWTNNPYVTYNKKNYKADNIFGSRQMLEDKYNRDDVNYTFQYNKQKMYYSSKELKTPFDYDLGTDILCNTDVDKMENFKLNGRILESLHYDKCSINLDGVRFFISDSDLYLIINNLDDNIKLF